MASMPIWCGLVMMAIGAFVGWIAGYVVAQENILDDPRSLSVKDYEKLRRKILEKDNT